jgi:hypothetical protein
MQTTKQHGGKYLNTEGLSRLQECRILGKVRFAFVVFSVVAGVSAAHASVEPIVTLGGAVEKGPGPGAASATFVVEVSGHRQQLDVDVLYTTSGSW